MQTPWPIQFELVVDHVHDGDTVYGQLFADAGLNIWINLGRPADFWGLRFYGINCPELNAKDLTERANAVACRDYLELHVGKGDTLKVDSYSFDKYGGRIDGIPYIDGMNLCDLMLAYGHGTVTM